jgi:hypothetical protein
VCEEAKCKNASLTPPSLSRKDSMEVKNFSRRTFLCRLCVSVSASGRVYFRKNSRIFEGYSKEQRGL